MIRWSDTLRISEIPPNYTWWYIWCSTPRSRKGKSDLVAVVWGTGEVSYQRHTSFGNSLLMLLLFFVRLVGVFETSLPLLELGCQEKDSTGERCWLQYWSVTSYVPESVYRHQWCLACGLAPMSCSRKAIGSACPTAHFLKWELIQSDTKPHIRVRN